MKALLIGIAAAGLVGVTTARAEHQGSTPDKSAATTTANPSPEAQKPADSSMSQTPSSQSTTSQASSSATGTTASASADVSGVVKKIDKDKKSLKISSPSGGEQDLKLADSATITRDGSQAALDQIKEGDQVRASFDASGSKASKIEVSSKMKADESGSKSESKEKK
jgi:Cu/Ag efflux protein CusF